MKNYYNLNTESLDYVIYCRKSSEGEDKQVQSLETQLRELQEHAVKNGLNVVETISESKSAFKEGREGYARLVHLIRTKRANAILVVRANRISRNPVDAGTVISLMDEKKLLYIRSPHSACYTCSPTDKLMLGLELLISKKDSDEKGEMVKEGQVTKALKGIPHGVAALGFLNDRSDEKGNRKWMVDQVRLPLIEILLKKFLTGTYSAGKLHKYAVGELKLTTVPRTKIGGELIQLSRMYEILKDPTYAGFFFYGGQRYELDRNLPRLITEAEHNKIKMLLSKAHIPKVQHHQTTYSGFMSSHDEGTIGQDVKFQLICDCKHKFAYRSKTHCPSCGIEIEKMEHPKYLSYVWHYNIKAKKAGESYKSIASSDIDVFMAKFALENLQFSPSLVEWSKKYIHELKGQEVVDKITLSKNREARKAEFEEKKAKLRAMYRDGKFTEEEYNDDLKRLNDSYADVTTSDDEVVDWHSRMLEIADVTESIAKVFTGTDIEAKRTMLSKLGSNLIWNNEELNIPTILRLKSLSKGLNEQNQLIQSSNLETTL